MLFSPSFIEHANDSLMLPTENDIIAEFSGRGLYRCTNFSRISWLLPPFFEREVEL
jgi:hypothetical protein